MMGLTLRSIVAKLTLDAVEFQEGLEKSLGGADKFASSMKRVGDKLAKTGAMMTAAITLPVALMGKEVVGAASDMAESINKVEVVFRGNAGTIKAWASTAADSMGMSSQAALEAAGTYGNLFTALGVLPDKTAEMSTSLVQLAGDLASFNNASPADTLEALRSGISGEAEPLKKFGVAMNDATLSVMAMKLGLGDNMLALSEAEKAQVRYALIMEQTKTAQGDFANTSDGLAGSMKTLTAKIEDLKVAMGEQLLPMALDLTNGLIQLTDWFGSLDKGTQKTIVEIGIFLAVLGPVVTTIGAVLKVGAAIPGIIHGASAAVTALAGVFGICTFAMTAWLAIAAVLVAEGVIIAGQLGKITAAEEKVNDALDEHEAQIVATSDSYEDYAKELIRVEKLANRTGKTGEKIYYMEKYGASVEEITHALGGLTEAEYNLQRANESGVAGANEYAMAHITVGGTLEGGSVAAAQYAEAMARLNTASAALPETGKMVDGFWTTFRDGKQGIYDTHQVLIDFPKTVGELTTAFINGKIGPEQYAEAVKGISDKFDALDKQQDTTFKNLQKNYPDIFGQPTGDYAFAGAGSYIPTVWWSGGVGAGFHGNEDMGIFAVKVQEANDKIDAQVEQWRSITGQLDILTTDNIPKMANSLTNGPEEVSRRILQNFLDIPNDINVTIHVATVGGGGGGAGSGSRSGMTENDFASGVSNFRVPAGYPNDSYLVGLTSGETVTVTPAMSPAFSNVGNPNEAQQGGNTYNIFAQETPGEVMHGLEIAQLMGGAA